MESLPHEPVLFQEVIDNLSPGPGKVFVDGTLGRAGHTKGFLERGAHVVGIDRDPAAIAAAPQHERLVVAHGQYSDIPAILGRLERTTVDGILLDLGVSSPQLDEAERGFSFTRSGPLDMRMDPTHGPTALDLIRSTHADGLGELLLDLGEERHGRRIARAIKQAEAAGALHTTADLAAICAREIPLPEQRRSKIHPATRTFQALRIAVNRELDELERFLAVFPDLLHPGGRCAIIAFHSLEDRLVKNSFRDLTWTSSLPERLARDAGERISPVVTLVTKRPIVAGEDEVARNPRARSARLRVCERTTAANLPMVRALA